MPVYNGEKFLKDAIESILSQTYNFFEFLIVYDASSDNSLSIINKFKNKDERIILINGDGKGIIHALNKGIKKSKGRYIARMDCDDISLPTRLEMQINYMVKNRLDICGCHCFYIDKYNQINDVNMSPVSHNMCFISLASKVPFAHPSVMIRKDFLTNNNLLYGQTNNKAAEDLDLWVRIYKKGGKFGNVNKVLFKYRVVKNSLSEVNKKGVAKDTKNILDNFFKDNKDDLLNALICKKNNLNTEEESLRVRLAFKFFLSTYSFGIFKYLKGTNYKVAIYAILSEIKTKV